ncbi:MULTISPECIES: hypothetical protein [unclassified Caulobacter]|uniref:hypothetical protein n=1 Tax=unclassified Caulobacter TaxID=2648921 RepID=UPI0006F4DBFC|nr:MULTISPECIES: hypothetical protein [unclassified Caulobacter]KQV62824.1 hypothetical protein ASC62_04645 [Caulobacter sp. Root342]KQV71957.1 hypothetical protein ASC70_23920 [Caulobacter sp. Root343]
MPMHVSYVAVIGWLLILAACFLAWRLGGKPERQGALLVLATSFLASFPGLIPDHDLQRVAYLAVDGVLAGGLLLLALRYARIWLGVAVLLQGVQFSLHAYYIVAGRRYDYTYGAVNNMVSLGVLCSLVTGSILALRARRRNAAAK